MNSKTPAQHLTEQKAEHPDVQLTKSKPKPQAKCYATAHREGRLVCCSKVKGHDGYHQDHTVSIAWRPSSGDETP